ETPTKPAGDSVGIPAIHGGEDVKYRVPTLSVAPCCDRAFPRAVVVQSWSNSRASPPAQSPPAAQAQTAADASPGAAPAVQACQSSPDSTTGRPYQSAPALSLPALCSP